MSKTVADNPYTNKILRLTGNLKSYPYPGKGGGARLAAKATVNVEHVKNLQRDLQVVLEFWQQQKFSPINGALVDVHYCRLIPKTSRIEALLGIGLKSDFVRGARFGHRKMRATDDSGDLHESDQVYHVITYYVDLQAISKSIRELDVVAQYMEDEFNGTIDAEDHKSLRARGGLSASRIKRLVFDCCQVQHIEVPEGKAYSGNEESLTSLYRTEKSVKEVLREIGLVITPDKMLDPLTVRLTPEERTVLQSKAPYLVAMQTADLSEFAPEEFFDESRQSASIPDPADEPIIGVIDTQFDSSVYFSKWVDSTCMLDENLIQSEDRKHGTMVCSLIVDGPSINPGLDDGCGRFRVKHFGVAINGANSVSTIIKCIREAVRANPQIKVWNVSLGSPSEVNENFISVEAAELDRLQNLYDVVFVVAGTNATNGLETCKRVGAPADSLNSIVVNAVNAKGESASYSRCGPVLGFFIKPDVCSFGGEGRDLMHVCTPLGEDWKQGTSFAAPWIARKLAYLINIMGFSRQTAKALLIDSAAGWEGLQEREHYFRGWGTVPQHIEDVLKTRNDQIRFIIEGTAEKYETSSYVIPVPQVKSGFHSYHARAVLCYFPACTRDQGVDYTDTELDLHFGPIDKKNRIGSLNGNQQGENIPLNLPEKEARESFRKWDNTKRICQKITNIHKVGNRDGFWGVKVCLKHRHSDVNRGAGLNFSLVVTLEDKKGEDRYARFVKDCQARGWYVEEIDVSNQLTLYQQAEEEIVLQ